MLVNLAGLIFKTKQRVRSYACIKHHFWPIDTNGRIAQLEQLTDDLKAPQKASGLFFGPPVSFDTISDPPKALSSGHTGRNSKLLCSRLENKRAKFSNMTSMGEK